MPGSRLCTTTLFLVCSMASGRAQFKALTLALLAAGYGCADAEPDIGHPREPAEQALKALAAANEVSRNPSYQREHAVAHDAKPHEGETEGENLPVHRTACRVHELRQKGQKEDCGLRVEEVHHKAVPEGAMQRLRLDLR